MQTKKEQLMICSERQERILSELRAHKVVSVARLAQKCYVSPCTLRRDLDQLEKMGLLHRSYGRAILAEHPNEQISYNVRDNECHQEKDTIGSLAAELVKSGDFVLLDSSSTAKYLLPYLSARRDLSILTNGAQMALDCLQMMDNATVYTLGGRLSPFFRGAVGSAALEQLSTYRPDIGFISVRAVTPDGAVCDVDEDVTYLKKKMLQVCRKRVLLCDSRKFTRVSYRVVCRLEELDCLVTEKCPEPEWLRALESAGVELICPGV